MKRAAMTLIFLAALSIPFSMAAHDKKMHRGKAIEGEITSASGDRFEMKTPTGAMSVTLSSKTKFEHGEEAVDKTHLKVGEHVSVFGTKVSKSEISANEVLLGAADAKRRKDKMSGMDKGKMDGMKGMEHGKMKPGGSR